MKQKKQDYAGWYMQVRVCEFMDIWIYGYMDIYGLLSTYKEYFINFIKSKQCLLHKREDIISQADACA